MASCFIAIDKCTNENGSLKLVEGSHKLGRIDHVTTGKQAEADPERIEQILKTHKLVQPDLNPGDSIWFHCNTLHQSGPNTSENTRWTAIYSYNSKKNVPYKVHHHEPYTALDRWHDSAVMRLGDTGITPGDGSMFMDPTIDVSYDKEKVGKN